MPPDRLPVIRVDQVHLEQIFQNLIGNALKYRGESAAKVHVAAALDGTEWTFRVADNGIGIDPQYSERIFGIFKRLHTAEEYPGTGIGLAICQKLVQRYGGRIWVESELGRGSTFCFTLRAATEGQA
jgi:light-regulated signal transduction histidine kinase (bacteriophytochrome)